jgi:hypothetical protein
MLIYTHCWELMSSVGSHGSLSLLFVMKVMVCHFVSNSHEVMTALIVVLPLIVVVEILCNFIKLTCFPTSYIAQRICWSSLMSLVLKPVFQFYYCNGFGEKN